MINQIFLRIWSLKHISTFEPKYFSCSETTGAWDPSSCWMRERQNLFVYFPNPKFRFLHLESKTQNAFSYMFGLSHTMPPVHGSAQQHMNSHCMHCSSPTETTLESCSWKGKGSGPALFSVSPWQPLSPPSGCHIKEILPPLRFNTSLKTPGEVPQPQPQRLESTSLLKLWSI